MTIIEAHRVRTIHRAIESIEPTTSSERAIHRAALIECSRRRREASSMGVVPALLLGPLSLLFALWVGIAGSTLGGSPDVEVGGTGSQGQISDSLRSQTHETNDETKGETYRDEGETSKTPSDLRFYTFVSHRLTSSHSPALLVSPRPGGYVVDPTGRRGWDVPVDGTKIFNTNKEAPHGSW